MPELEQQQIPSSKPKQPRRMIRKVLWLLLMVLVLLFASLAVLISSDRGSKFLLDRVMEQQKMVQYQYESGNLLRGIIVKNIVVDLQDLDIKADRADVVLGWRALFSREELHFSRANVRNLQIIMTKPSDHKPFLFKPIRLPFVLRVDTLKTDHLLIHVRKTKVNFYDIQLNKALWKDTALSFEKSKVNMGYLFVKNATGGIRFDGKYPIHLTGDLNIPSLRHINIHTIKVVAKGSLDTLRAGVATPTPDLLTGWIVLHPLQHNVPMFGALNFKRYHWPILSQQKIYSQNGVAHFNGDANGFHIALNTDYEGVNVPKGQYSARMFTDFVHQLDVSQLNAKTLNGSINLAGNVNWQHHVTWSAKGRAEKLNPKDKHIPAVVQQFLPTLMNANIESTGSLEKGLQVQGRVDFDHQEHWSVNLNQAQNVGKKSSPLLINVNWQNIDRAVPYVGWLNSASGATQLKLVSGRQDIWVSSTLRQSDKSILPAGTYQAQLALHQNNLNIPKVSYQLGNSSLSGQANLLLPTAKRALSWSAMLTAKQFNPQSIYPAVPVNLLNGTVKANGLSQPNQHIVSFSSIALTGQVPQARKIETVQLSGKSTAAFLFQEAKLGGAFKGYAVNFDGALNALNQGNGLLKFRIAGTPQYLNIAELQHAGVAGRVYANGVVNLTHGVQWNINSSLVHFKPQYFLSTLQGDLSGNLKTQGIWAGNEQRINVQDLNMAGVLNQKVLRGKGNLSLVFNGNANNFKPQHFEANQFYVAYGKNQFQASGNEQNLNVKLKAPALNELYSGLRGQAYGYINVMLQPKLKALANVAVEHFSFRNLLSVKKLTIQGELPTSETTPTLLKAKLEHLISGDRVIQQAEVSLAGTRRAHVLKVSSSNQAVKLYAQLAGGLTANNDWIGQLQQGTYESKRASLKQNQNANVFWNSTKNELLLSAHCWTAQQSQVCFDQPIRLSPNKGDISLKSKNVELHDFEAFLPSGMALTGKLDGFAKVAWINSGKPKIDVRLVTRNGQIGLAPEDPQEDPTTVSYNQLSLIAKSVNEGLLLRVDVSTPEIGTGYANVIVNPYQTPKPMYGNIAFNDVQLKVLKPFIRDVRSMGGTLAMAGKVSGTLTQPEISGDFRLKNGSISMMSMPVNLSNIQIYSTFRRDNATINGAFNSGRGVGLLTGNIDWKNDPRISLNLKGDNLLLRQAPIVTAIVKPNVNLEILPVQKSLSVNGTVEVPRALISMPEASAPVVNVSSDVRIVRDGKNQLAILKAARPWDINANIAVSLGNQVIFQGFDSRIPLLGKVNLYQRGAETAMRANGAIGVSQRVKIEAYGQSLDLNRAIARFNGPLASPSLDIDANKKVQGSTVGVRVSGTVIAPNIQIYNDAGLSEQEALNAILTGRINEGVSGLTNTNSFKTDVNQTIAAAGISMGLGGTRALTNQIGRTFGLKSLAIDAQGSGSDTQVNVTGYLTPDLYIRYGVGVFTPVNKLTLRYQMNKRLYLEASQSLERAIDLFYSWRF